MKRRMVTSILRTAEVFNRKYEADKQDRTFIRFIGKCDMYCDVMGVPNTITYIFSEDNKIITEIYTKDFCYKYNTQTKCFDLQ